jgi:two-component system, OmpR family, sensor kinase
MPGFLDVHDRLPVQRTVWGRLVFEIGLVCVGLVVVGLVSLVLDTRVDPSRRDLVFVLALLAAGVGTAAAVLGHTASRITGNRRAAWLVPALALYSLDIIPDTAMQSDPTRVPDLGLLIDSAVLGCLLAAGIRPPARWGSGAAWAAAGGCLIVGWFVEGQAPMYLPVGPQSAVPTVLSLGVLLGWCALSVAVVLVGYLTASAPLWRVGLGFGVIASAHLLRRLELTISVEPGIFFSALRLLGVVVVMLGMAQLLRRALHLLLAERFSQQEELRLASIRAQESVRAAFEREHELRNGLSGLAGVARLLSSGPDDDGSRRARSAAITELHRLSELLDRRPGRDAVDLYSAREVVEELVALWRMTGMPIEVKLADDLMVVGRPSILAQVLTNLLCNCARHAAGATVRIVGRGIDDRTVIQVRDDGLGPSHQESARAPGEGDGLGLQICRRLLREEGGALVVHPPGPPSRGFAVTVEVRRLASALPQRPRVALDAGSAT